MLEHELRGEPYSKRAHNRQLQSLLNNRSSGAIERKHQNISAVMIELGLPYIEGYKPLANYQELLRNEVITQLDHHPSLDRAADAIVNAPAHIAPVGLTLDVFEPAPEPRERRATYERPNRSQSPSTRINYLECEARNTSLGLAGEKFVLEIEHRRLREAGAHQLAARVEHVSKTKGDGLGYDILSYEMDGRERFIEVKTTAFGKLTPFFATAREVKASEILHGFQLYRVFKFRDAPKIFALPGSLRQSTVLEPTEFRASVR